MSLLNIVEIKMILDEFLSLWEKMFQIENYRGQYINLPKEQQRRSRRPFLSVLIEVSLIVLATKSKRKFYFILITDVFLFGQTSLRYAHIGALTHCALQHFPACAM